MPSPTPTPERNGESINYMRPGDSFHCLICHKDMPTKGAQGMDAHRLICEGEATSCGRMNGKACEKQPTPESRLREEWERECIENMNDNIYLSIGATADWWLSKLSQERERARGEAIRECIEVAKNSKATFFGTKDSAEPPLEEALYELKAEIVTNLERLLFASLTHTKL